MAEGEADGEGDSSAVELFFLAEAFGEAEASALVELFFFVEVLDALPVPVFLVDFLVVDSVVDAAVVLVVSFFSAQETKNATTTITTIEDKAVFFIGMFTDTRLFSRP